MQKAQITNNYRMLIEFWLKFKNVFWPSQNLWHAPSPLLFPAWEVGMLKVLEKHFLVGGWGQKNYFGLVGA